MEETLIFTGHPRGAIQFASIAKVNPLFVGPITKAASDALLADHNSVDLTGWSGFLHDL
jgi:hypothetical protein